MPSNGLLGVEVDQSLVPGGFRNKVNEGDRVAIFGRWILDQAHPNKNHDAFRTEIHPPLLMATGSVQADPATGAQFTQVLFMSRPYLTGQRFCKDPNNAYDDTNDDDGAFKDHLIKELVNVLIPLLSEQVHFYSKIKSHPFLGAHLFHFIVRPPALPALGRVVAETLQMEISFNFWVRQGCAVQIISPTRGQVDVLIAMNDQGYMPPKLPTRQETTWRIDDLNQVYSGAGDLVFAAADSSLGLLATLLGGPINLARVEAILNANGVITDIYSAVPEFNILGTSGAVLNVAANQIPADQGITVNNSDDQPLPVFGWLEARWPPRESWRAPLGSTGPTRFPQRVKRRCGTSKHDACS